MISIIRAVGAGCICFSARVACFTCTRVTVYVRERGSQRSALRAPIQSMPIRKFESNGSLASTPAFRKNLNISLSCLSLRTYEMRL